MTEYKTRRQIYALPAPDDFGVLQRMHYDEKGDFLDLQGSSPTTPDWMQSNAASDSQGASSSSGAPVPVLKAKPKTLPKYAPKPPATPPPAHLLAETKTEEEENTKRFVFTPSAGSKRKREEH